jgi:hypothetical protein
MSDTSNTGTGSGNNSNTSKWGWSGSTLGSASGGARSGNPFNPALPKGKFGNSMPGDKKGGGTKLAIGSGVAAVLILANNADVPVVQPTPYTGYSENSPRGRENLGGGGGNGLGSGDAINIASKEVLVNDVKQKEGNKTPEQIGLLTLTNIGGRELTKLSRHNEINGINQEYSPIANLADISLQYSPLAISPNADNVSSFLSTFNLDITKYIPTQEELEEYYPLETDVSKRKIILFDKETNSLIVHVKNIFTNEKIEIEFIVPSEVKDGTIY